MMGRRIRAALNGSLVNLAVRPVLTEGVGGSLFLRIAIDQRKDVPSRFQPLLSLYPRPVCTWLRQRF